MNHVIVIGGGPAGMMAAIRSAQLGNKVTLLEKNQSLGKKLLLTGKGRCNITNAAGIDEFITRFSKNAQFLRDAFKEFFVEELFDFFQQRGLTLKIERQKRVFPSTDSAISVLNVLKKELKISGVHVSYNSKVNSITVKNSQVDGVRLSDSKCLPADKIIIATGGISYAFTGSSGDGHKIAQNTGHTIIPLRPALVSLKVKQLYVKSLEGLTLKNIQLTFSTNKKTIKSEIGELLFTDNGVSGPLVVSMSADLLDFLNLNGKLALEIDLKPALDTEKLDLRLLREIESAPKRTLLNLLKTMLPVRLVGVFITLSGIDKNTKSAHIAGFQRKKILSFLKSWRFDVLGSAGIEKAMVTRGGVSLKDIDPKTMQSRIIKGLYFAGEIIDVDADTGGFNLQAAFSTGYLAGGQIAAKAEQQPA
jgi:predicted Rossmann fold flavoprotein